RQSGRGGGSACADQGRPHPCGLRQALLQPRHPRPAALPPGDRLDDGRDRCLRRVDRRRGEGDSWLFAAVTRYLKRLASSLAAYQVADVVSKFIAVLLLPVYTRYINPAGYGVVELLATGVIFVSIIVRFGIIEAFLRYYFVDEDAGRRDALVRPSEVFLLIS